MQTGPLCGEMPKEGAEEVSQTVLALKPPLASEWGRQEMTAAESYVLGRAWWPQ